MKRSCLQVIMVLAAILTMLALAACNDADHGPGGAFGTGGADVFGGPEPQDLGGFEFTIVDFASDRFIPGSDGLGTPRGQAMMDAIESIEEDFNMTFVTRYVGPSEILQQVQPAVFAGDKFGDMIMTTMWAYGHLIAAGLMRDLSTLENLDLDSPWWIQEAAEASTIGGEVLAMAGINSHWPHAWVVYFNKRIWDEMSFPDPYELVRNGEWTFERMREFMAAASMDFDGDGVVNTIDDRWGLATPDGDFARAMFMGMGGRYFVYNPETGLLDIAFAEPEAAEIVHFMSDFVRTPGLTWRGNTHVTYTMNMFNDGRALFFAYMMGGPGELREMADDWGMLPTPMGFHGQETYINKVDHNAPLFGITVTNREAENAALIMEALGARFEPVRRLALDELESVFLRSDDCIDMIPFIENNLGFDLALILQNANDRVNAPMGLIFGSTFGAGAADFTADVETIRPVLEYEVNRFILRPEIE